MIISSYGLQLRLLGLDTIDLGGRRLAGSYSYQRSRRHAP